MLRVFLPLFSYSTILGNSHECDPGVTRSKQYDNSYAAGPLTAVPVQEQVSFLSKGHSKGRSKSHSKGQSKGQFIITLYIYCA